MKPELIDLYFIPEEYRQQVSGLIQSDDMSNWDLLYQLMIGFNNNQLSLFAVECYFRAILNNYRMYYCWELELVKRRLRIGDYLYQFKPYKEWHT